jgi:hypothetical protein
VPLLVVKATRPSEQSATPYVTTVNYVGCCGVLAAALCFSVLPPKKGIAAVPSRRGPNDLLLWANPGDSRTTWDLLAQAATVRPDMTGVPITFKVRMHDGAAARGRRRSSKALCTANRAARLWLDDAHLLLRAHLCPNLLQLAGRMGKCGNVGHLTASSTCSNTRSFMGPAQGARWTLYKAAGVKDGYYIRFNVRREAGHVCLHCCSPGDVCCADEVTCFATMFLNNTLPCSSASGTSQMPSGVPGCIKTQGASAGLR